jgi:hypothetical protein
MSLEILAFTPHTSHLAPRTSHLAPRTSHLAPRTSHLAPRTSHLTPHTSRSPRPAICTLSCHNKFGTLADTSRQSTFTQLTHSIDERTASTTHPGIITQVTQAIEKGVEKVDSFIEAVSVACGSGRRLTCAITDTSLEDRTHHGRRCGRRTPRADDD